MASEAAQRRLFLFGSEKSRIGNPCWGKLSLRMFQEGEEFFIGMDYFDQEEGHYYDFQGCFSLKEFREAMKALETVRQVRIWGPRQAELDFVLKGESVHFHFNCPEVNVENSNGIGHFELKLPEVKDWLNIF